MVLEIKQSNRVVIGLFPNRADAYRAVEELRESGFSLEEIGAAFRRESKGSWSPRRTTAEETVNLNDVKNLFTSKEEWEKRKEKRLQDAVAYRTGAGHQPLPSESSVHWRDSSCDCEAADFSSLLMDLGLAPETAQYFARLLPPGGAVVTVYAASRANEAELILESNNGRVRMGARSMEEVDLGEQYDDDRVVVFGEVQRAYRHRDEKSPVRAEDLEGFPGRIRHIRRSA
jgi:hypothetical protein